MFQSRFADALMDGAKTTTIRPVRKAPIVAGDKLSLRRWVDKPYRSKQVVLREAECTRVASIVMHRTFSEFLFLVDGKQLDAIQWAALARADGFSCTTDMLDWFEAMHGLPFRGVLIQW